MVLGLSDTYLQESAAGLFMHDTAHDVWIVRCLPARINDRGLLMHDMPLNAWLASYCTTLHMALLLSTAELCFAGLQQQQQQQQQQRIQQDQHPYLTAKDHVNNPHVAAAAPSAAAAAAAAGTAWPIQALSQLCDLTPPDGGPPSSGDAHSTADSCAQLRLHCMAQLATIAGDAASSYATSSDANAALSNAASTSTNAASSSANASAVPSQYYAVRQRVFRRCGLPECFLPLRAVQTLGDLLPTAAWVPTMYSLPRGNASRIRPSVKKCD
eukprot:1161878-Pelagomonas_calceolata.AAC.9